MLVDDVLSLWNGYPYYHRCLERSCIVNEHRPFVTVVVLTYGSVLSFVWHRLESHYPSGGYIHQTGDHSLDNSYNFDSIDRPVLWSRTKTNNNPHDDPAGSMAVGIVQWMIGIRIDGMIPSQEWRFGMWRSMVMMMKT